MNKKSIAIVIVILFTFLNCSTYVTKVVNTTDISSNNRESIKVLGVVTNADKWIEFDIEPGRIVKNSIEGEVEDEFRSSKLISIPLLEVKRIWLKKYSPVKFVWNYLLRPVGGAFIVMAIGFIVSPKF